MREPTAGAGAGNKRKGESWPQGYETASHGRRGSVTETMEKKKKK